MIHLLFLLLPFSLSTTTALNWRSPTPSFSSVLLAHRHSAITSICFGVNNMMYTGDDTGEVDSWNLSENMNIGRNVYSLGGGSVTSMFFANDFLLVAYANGTIRCLEPLQLAVVAQISAHSRPITSLTKDPSNSFFASVSEDGHCNVWTIPSAMKCKIYIISSQLVDRAMLVGACWIARKHKKSTSSADEHQYNVREFFDKHSKVEASHAEMINDSVLAVIAYDSKTLTMLH
jgi:WD40 repeat protein